MIGMIAPRFVNGAILSPRSGKNLPHGMDGIWYNIPIMDKVWGVALGVLAASILAAEGQDAEFDIPESLIVKMYHAHDALRDRNLKLKGMDAQELYSLALIPGLTNAEVIASRPRGEMKFVDDLNSEEERLKLWPFEIEKFEAQLLSQMVKDENGLYCRTNSAGVADASNPTIRWVNREIAEWTIREMDKRHKRLGAADVRTVTGIGNPGEGITAWRIDEMYCYVLAKSDGAYGPYGHAFAIWNGKGGGDAFVMPVATFDSFPNAKEAVAALCFHCDAASLNNLAVLQWRHRIDRLSMDPWTILALLEKAKKCGVPTAEGNLKTLLSHMPEVKEAKPGCLGSDPSGGVGVVE